MDCSMPGNLYGYRGFCGGSVVKNQPEMQETQVWFLGCKDSLEKEMAVYFSALAWEILQIVRHDRLQSRGLQKSWTWLRNLTTTTYIDIWYIYRQTHKLILRIIHVIFWSLRIIWRQYFFFLRGSQSFFSRCSTDWMRLSYIIKCFVLFCF